MDPVIGQVGRIAADSGLLRPFVDARAVALVGVALVSDPDLQLAVGRHETQSAERPLVDVAESHYVFNVIFISCFPMGIFVIGHKFYHSKWHPWSGAYHPS